MYIIIISVSQNDSCVIVMWLGTTEYAAVCKQQYNIWANTNLASVCLFIDAFQRIARIQFYLMTIDLLNEILYENHLQSVIQPITCWSNAIAHRKHFCFWETRRNGIDVILPSSVMQTFKWIILHYYLATVRFSLD